MKDIPGYEGLYAITSCGKVWSYKSKKFRKPKLTKHGYCQVQLHKNGKRKDYLIHRLVAEVYLPNPDNLPEVNHIDEDKSNNALSNLEWISHKDNLNFGTRLERIAKSLQKKVICVESGEIFNSIKEAAKAIDIDPSSISKACKGKLKTSGGYHWAYYEDKE